MLAPNPQALAPTKYHDVTIVYKRKSECARVEPVPPEEFGIDKNAKCIRDAGYCYHEKARRQDELLADGYDFDCINNLPGYVDTSSLESQSRDTVDESSDMGEDVSNRATRLIKYTEHYSVLDYQGDGKPRLYRVCTGGDDGTILTVDGEPAIYEEDYIPFAAMTPVIVTHRFFGRSIADLVMDIQRIKTALVRGMLDNVYMVTRPRPVVDETRAGDNTYDDLLASDHGRPIRVKQDAPAAVIWQQVPDITNSLYPAIQYMDATREWRTGVTRQGQGVDPNALQNQVATIANQMFNAAQAKVKLIARIFAETGIKDMFSLLHATIRKHGSKAQTVRLRNQWVQVDPREWKKRNDLTINVGLGTGGKTEQMQSMLAIVALQEKAVAAGLTNLVGAEQLYNSAKEVTKLAGYRDSDKFFTNPAGKPPPQPQPDPKMLELQMKGELEKTQMQADMAFKEREQQGQAALAQQKFAHESALEERRFELEKELKLIDAQLKVREHEVTMQRDNAKHEQEMHGKAIDAQYKEREAATKERGAQLKFRTDLVRARMKGAGKEEDDDEDAIATAAGEILDADSKRSEQSAKSMAELAAAIKEMVAAQMAETEIIRDPKTNRAIGARRKSLN